MSVRRFGPLDQLGLRSRIVASFSLASLLIAGLVSFAAVSWSRGNLIAEREELLADRADVNAAAVSSAAERADADLQAVFGSISAAGRPSVILIDDSGAERPISFDSRFGVPAVPRALRDRALGGQRGIMRYALDGDVLLAIGVPLDDGRGAYFEISELGDIEAAVRGLALRLIGATAAAGLLGAILGYGVSRRVLRPLADVAEVAEDVAAGRLDARLAYVEWADDPDLAPLLGSFNDMVAALQARIDRDARFASDVSHELRSPLTTFSASLEVLHNAREELPERAQVALDLLTSDMDRFRQLVEDLLEISRFDAGAVRLELDDVLVAETVRMSVRAATPERIPVIADETLEDLIIRCDKRRLVRIIANFIDNARKYGEGATEVTVQRAEIEAEDDDEVETVIRIGVEDRGPGVPEPERERIFDRFNRGDQGGSRGTDLGVGLGLALAAEHANLQGGRVWVEGRTDGESGARFVVELPLIEASEPLDEPTLDEAPPTGSVPAVVIGDDAVHRDGAP